VLEAILMIGMIFASLLPEYRLFSDPCGEHGRKEKSYED
jgi:hypothetical protein